MNRGNFQTCTKVVQSLAHSAIEGVPKLVTAYLDQVRKLQQATMLSKLSGNKLSKVDEKQIYQWAAARVCPVH